MISHLLVMYVMNLGLTYDNNVSPMIILFVFDFALLSDSDTSAAHAATCAWDTLLEGTSTPSIYNNMEFFRDNSSPPNKDLSDSK